MASHLGSVTLTFKNGGAYAKAVLLNTDHVQSFKADGTGASIQYQAIFPDQNWTLLTASAATALQTEFNTVNAGVAHSQILLPILNQATAAAEPAYLSTANIAWVEAWPTNSNQSLVLYADVTTKQITTLQVNATVAAIKALANA